MCLFTDFVADQDVKYFYGWSMVACVLINIAVNLLIVIIFGLKSLYMVLKKYSRIFIKCCERSDHIKDGISLKHEIAKEKKDEEIAKKDDETVDEIEL